MPLHIYYERHLNVPAQAPELWSNFVQLAEDNDYRASKFDGDHVDNADGQWFLSARCGTETMAKKSILSMLTTLQFFGIKVLRWKIEAAIWDSKNGHTLEDIS